jgi:hypothetical protein
MMLLMGMLRERRENEGQPMAEGTKTVETEKTPSSDSTTKSLGGVEDRAFLSIDPSRALRSASEGHDAFARVDRSFATVRDATSVVTTHSVRSLTRNPKLIVPGGLDRARPREDDLSRRGIVRGVECD